MSNVIQMTPASVGLSADWMRRKAPELVRDIVCQLDTASNLAEQKGLTPIQWQVLKEWPAFKQMVAEVREELAGSAGTTERARRKAAVAIAEMGVQDLAVIMGDPKENARDRIAAFDQLKDIAVMGSKQQIAAAAAGSGGAISFGGPLIQINLPNGTQLHVGEVSPAADIVPVIEGESTRLESDK